MIRFLWDHVSTENNCEKKSGKTIGKEKPLVLTSRGSCLEKKMYAMPLLQNT